MNGFTISGHISKPKIHADRAELKNALTGADGYTSQLGFNAGNQFGGLEWLGHVIIGAELKGYDLVGSLMTRTQNDQGSGNASFTNGLAYVQSAAVVLMDGGSFSTTCEFLSNLHDKKRGIFVDEEAGGGYYGNTSGPSVPITLPNAKVRVRIPLRTYYLAVTDGQPNRSILPDYEVTPTIGDLLSKKDPVMERAIELARSGS